METDFCVDALREATERHGRPEIFNTDQDVQFTSAAFLDELSGQGVRISMDGKWRLLNIFIERLWRSLKYEEVYIKAYGSVAEARQGIGAWLRFYNEKRPHQEIASLLRDGLRRCTSAFLVAGFITVEGMESIAAPLRA